MASNEQRLMCFVGLDTSLVLLAIWVIYVCVAQGTCTPNKLLVNDEMEDRVHSSVNAGASLVGALSLSRRRMRTDVGD